MAVLSNHLPFGVVIWVRVHKKPFHYFFFLGMIITSHWLGDPNHTYYAYSHGPVSTGSETRAFSFIR